MQDLKKRLFQFAVDVAMLIQKLQKGVVNNAYVNQLVRCSSSPGTNYRAALRGKSQADYINKLKIVQEELDECMYFLELLHYFNPDERAEIDVLNKEANELLSIIVASIKTSRSNSRTS